jgi:hypothetical protein
MTHRMEAQPHLPSSANSVIQPASVTAPWSQGKQVPSIKCAAGRLCPVFTTCSSTSAICPFTRRQRNRVPNMSTARSFGARRDRDPTLRSTKRQHQLRRHGTLPEHKILHGSARQATHMSTAPSHMKGRQCSTAQISLSNTRCSSQNSQAPIWENVAVVR